MYLKTTAKTQLLQLYLSTETVCERPQKFDIYMFLNMRKSAAKISVLDYQHTQKLQGKFSLSSTLVSTPSNLYSQLFDKFDKSAY